jgi:bifunctional pyridoxal-dependent enzyme with beta-cystathionase and maltose regulon repressor activities
VFTRAEVEEIADLCKKHNVLMISDDVYEHMVGSHNSRRGIYGIGLCN